MNWKIAVCMRNTDQPRFKLATLWAPAHHERNQEVQLSAARVRVLEEHFFNRCQDLECSSLSLTAWVLVLVLGKENWGTSMALNACELMP